MHSNPGRKAVFAAALVVLLVAAGCTGTEKIVATGQETLTLEVQLVNTDTRFESASFLVVQVALQPLDPDAAQALQTEGGLGVVRLPVEISYAEAGARTVSVSVADGVYQVTALVLSSISYNDLDPPTSTATCQEYVSQWILSSINSTQTIFTFTDFGEDVFVTVESGGQNRLTLVIDGAALEDAFLDSWLCNRNFLCTPVAPWCTSWFLQDVFLAQGTEFIDFQ